jgi:hypothetical protein
MTKLEKEIRCECTRCVYSDSPCIRSDFGVEKDEDVCPNYKNVFVAYSQLKEENAELEKEIAELREKLNFSTQYYRGEEAMRQLTKAKVCLEQLVSEITVGELEVDPNVLQQAEQFLSEVEK